MNALWKNEKGMVLIWFYFLIVILMITSGAVFGLSFQEARLTSIEQDRTKAFYLAEAALDQKLDEMRNSDLNDIGSTDFGDGSFTADYDSGTKKITATGTVNGTTATVVAVVSKTIPPGVKGAISAVGSITFSGNINVDGRDYDPSGNLTGDAGSYGASSGGTITQSGSCTIGGNGIAPAHPANSATIEQNSGYSYTTPESVLGLSSGSLDQYKHSTAPTLPMSGIYYYTGSLLDAPDFGDEDSPSTGILILHNSTGSSQLKNMHGYFKGLIITDDLVHINGDAVVLGGVVLQKSTGNTVGNGAADVLYSSSVLSNLDTGDYSIVSWEDAKSTASYEYS